MTRPIATLVLALASCGALAGCANDDDRITPTTANAVIDTPAATHTPTATATAAPTPAGAGPMAGGSTQAQYAASQGTGTALLTKVREAEQDGYDRVVFEFRGTIPAYEVAYADGTITQDGSGKTVEIAGDARLTVRMSPAADADLADPDAPRTYTGPDRIATGHAGVVELARISGFEGALTWAIGVQTKTPFKVSTLTDPARIIVDIRRPAAATR